jgi:uncharacterized membrane protein YkvI
MVEEILVHRVGQFCRKSGVYVGGVVVEGFMLWLSGLQILKLGNGLSSSRDMAANVYIRFECLETFVNSYSS